MNKVFAILLIVIMAWGLASLSSCNAVDSPTLIGATPAPPSLVDLAVSEVYVRGTAQAAEHQAQEANQAAAAYQVVRQQLLQQQQLQATAAAADYARQERAQATQRAWTQVQWTATAVSAASTNEAARTTRAEGYTATAVAHDMQATATADVYLAGIWQRQQQRLDITNTAMAIGPLVLAALVVLGCLVVGTMALIKWWRRPQTISPNASGEYPILVGNGNQVLLPQLMPGAMARFTHEGGDPLPMAAEDVQERATARAQGLAASVHGQIHNPGNRGQAGSQPQAMAPVWRIIPAEETPAQLLQDPDVLPILEAQWRDEK